MFDHNMWVKLRDKARAEGSATLTVAIEPAYYAKFCKFIKNKKNRDKNKRELGRLTFSQTQAGVAVTLTSLLPIAFTVSEPIVEADTRLSKNDMVTALKNLDLETTTETTIEEDTEDGSTNDSV